MVYVGFLFNIDLDESGEKYVRISNQKSEIFGHCLTNKIINKGSIKKNIVVFLNMKIQQSSGSLNNARNIEGNFIIGVSNFKEKECDFFYLDKDFNLKKFLVFEKSKFKVGKILANDKNVIDFEYLTFWFKGESYRLIRETLLINEGIEDLRKEIEDRIKFLRNYFI